MTIQDSHACRTQAARILDYFFLSLMYRSWLLTDASVRPGKNATRALTGSLGSVSWISTSAFVSCSFHFAPFPGSGELWSSIDANRTGQLFLPRTFFSRSLSSLGRRLASMELRSFVRMGEIDDGGVLVLVVLLGVTGVFLAVAYLSFLGVCGPVWLPSSS
ncbi:hypothetical protein BU23DRAFT_200152 [Bimuria novae-zelandiae CBS 107.79]|uniref:Uncharacterized protein n=1 Tax=Bimuria novae-zelandiae CBS 107.79 TaxID=1447943 RepID=A0A6A5V1G8_9PLEO|nr:hypothetical protein BU23DRAFT_200152 [Bimuria novae-zelandiae CBS 107.79]